MNKDVNPQTTAASNGTLVLVMSYALVPLALLSDWFLGHAYFQGAAVSIGLALIATLSSKMGSRLTHYVITLCLVGQVVVLTAIFRGHPWQIDTHMLYFVVLAGVSTLGSVRALLFAAGVTAVHHLGLTLVMPALVYPSVDLMENLLRTGLHGSLVVIETAVLTMATVQRNRLTAAMAEQSESLSDQSQRAEAAEATARRTMEEAQQAIAILRHNLHRLAERDMDCRIDKEMPAAFQDLRDDFNLAVTRLDAALGQAQSMAQRFDGEARLLDDLIDRLAQGTTSQAGDLGRQSEQIEQMSARLGDSARHAEKAAARVSTARAEADQGGEITREAVAAMERIEKSSGEVGNIMDLIDDIAFQTNLLALNAGVEAARAGSSGRGFAVVAGEVQALSQRTAEAARGVKELISSSEQEVSQGARLVHEAGRRLSQIVDHVSEVNGMIDAIRQDAGSRAEEMAEVSRRMLNLDSEAQKILGQSAEMAASGQRLRGHADELAHVMSEFNVAEQAKVAKRRVANG